MKSFSKRVASFAMAAAMVLSLAAVSPVDAQAAKKTSIEKKTSITAGNAYTYKIKNVTSKQYVKVTGITSGVTVKYNGKTVKKKSTKIYGKKSGAALALKVTAKDKIANYKATIKAQVYNKSNNKKVGSLLKTTTTVKCTKIEVKNVTIASNTGKYLVATFNKALTKLSVADVEVRKLNTNELKGVEKVELSSDGKRATVTLVGSEDTGTNKFIDPNTEYVFTVSQSGAKASTNFTVDAVKAYVTINAVDAATKTVWYTAPNPKDTNTTATNGSVSLREEVYSGDFQDLLGRTVTVWYNKNNVATKLATVDEIIVYGSFKYVASNTATLYFEDRASGKKYYEQITSGDVNATQIINLGTNKDFDWADQRIIDYAKLTPDNDYMKSLFKGGPAVTVYFDRTGQPAFIIGTPKGSENMHSKVHH